MNVNGKKKLLAHGMGSYFKCEQLFCIECNVTCHRCNQVKKKKKEKKNGRIANKT